VDLLDLERLLDDLRRTGDDHHRVEAKLARDDLPGTLWESISALSNAGGGTVLLGVAQTGTEFSVAGVEDPGRTCDAVRSLCDQLEPSPRPVITALHHRDGEVVVAEFASLAPHRRPCHKRSLGPRAGSFIRVGDADVQLSEAEVDEMLAAASYTDYSRRPAQQGAQLDARATGAFADRIRRRGPDADLPTAAVLERWNITAGGVPTVAGVLLLGRDPQENEPAATVAIVRQPRASDPPATRFALVRVSGTVGRLLDEVFAAVVDELRTVQVVRGGAVVDESDVPREALRELISNALMHRSLSPAMATKQARIDITDEAVTVTSPGGLHIGVDPARLGIDSLPSVRNHCLVRVAERLRTPAGSRIVEHAASGIPRADAASRRNATMPALFTDHPTEFRATLLRGSLDPAPARALLVSCGIEPRPEFLRLVSVLLRLEQLRGEAVGHLLARVPFDARMATRALAAASEEDAIVLVSALEAGGVVRRRALHGVRAWESVPSPDSLSPDSLSPDSPSADPVSLPVSTAARAHSASGGHRRRRRQDDLLLALGAAPDHQLRPVQIKGQLAISSPTTLNKLLTAANASGLIEPTEDDPHHPRKAFRLTRAGRAAADRLTGTSI